jgi:hypothetical protein
MKRLPVFLLIMIFIVFADINIKAQDKGFGAGIMIGQPTGFSGKIWANELNAMDFGVGFSFAKDDNGVNLHADYLWHSFSGIQSEEKFVLYYGPGLKLKAGNSKVGTKFGFRAVLGLEWMASQTPLDVFLEIAPLLYVAPGTQFKIDAAFGARYYFN